MSDSSRSVALAKLAIAHGISEAQMMEIVEDLQEAGMGNGHSRQFTEIMASKLNVCVMEVLRYIKIHLGKSIPVYAALRVQNNVWCDSLNAGLSPSQFAKTIRRSRAAVNKEIMLAQKFFNKPPRPDQRQTEARQKMRARRLDTHKPPRKTKINHHARTYPHQPR